MQRKEIMKAGVGAELYHARYDEDLKRDRGQKVTVVAVEPYGRNPEFREPYPSRLGRPASPGTPDLPKYVPSGRHSDRTNVLVANEDGWQFLADTRHLRGPWEAVKAEASEREQLRRSIADKNRTERQQRIDRNTAVQRRASSLGFHVSESGDYEARTPLGITAAELTRLLNALENAQTEINKLRDQLSDLDDQGAR